MESLRAEVEAAVRDRRLAVISELGEDAVLWLAVAPLWTWAAAEAAGFPVSSVTSFVRQACDAGWCKMRGSLVGDAPADLVFWMPDEVRREAVDLLRDRYGSEWSAQRPRWIGVAIAAAITAAGNLPTAAADAAAQPTRRAEPVEELMSEELLPGALVAWVDLMTGSPEPTFSRPPSFASSLASGVLPERPEAQPAGVGSGELLVAWTQRAVAARELGYAQDLVAAGEAIAGVFAGSTEQALSRARRLLALGQRRRQDERALARYLDRPELSDAVARLLGRDQAARRRHATEDGHWALHLRGVGGVGKTMLVRYLASGRYAADRGWPEIPMARGGLRPPQPGLPGAPPGAAAA
jgi:hypothetical protein